MDAVPAPPGSGVARYQVSVQWLPRHSWLVRRIGGWRRGGSTPDLPDGLDVFDNLDLGGDGGIFAAIAAIVLTLLVVILVAVLAWWVIIPVLLLVVDAVVLVGLALAGIALRLLFRRPWVVAVKDGDRTVATADVVGWRRARQKRDRIREYLARGASPAEAVLT